MTVLFATDVLDLAAGAVAAAFVVGMVVGTIQACVREARIARPVRKERQL